ncbi:hypothetical protein ACH5RR_032997 [Cinchona calisaya]|uniref:RNase H type-1 domain-containing protein n=1 Tax=Cinchona calisaya TaxID=153742 RepID=A0ABD2YN98_9GENT
MDALAFPQFVPFNLDLHFFARDNLGANINHCLKKGPGSVNKTALRKGLNVYKSGTRWVFKNGNKAKFCTDKWPGLSPFKALCMDLLPRVRTIPQLDMFLQLHSDSKVIVDLIDTNNYGTHHLSSIIYDCRALLRRFAGVEIKHNFKESNRVTDLMAKAGSNQLEDFLLHLVPPHFVKNLCMEDVRYMETNPGVFPKVTHIQKESTETVQQTQDKDRNIGHTITRAKEESFTVLTVEAATSEVTDMHNSFISCELQTPSTAQCTESGSEFCATEKDASENEKVHLSKKYYSEGMVQLNAVADTSLQLELDSHHMRTKELVSNFCETSDNNLPSNSEKFSHFERDKLNSTGCGDQQENKRLNCGLSLSSSDEMNRKSALPDTLQKDSRLADIFKKLTDDTAFAEGKNGKMESEASLSSILLSYGKDRRSQAESLLSTDITLLRKSRNRWQDLHVNKSVLNENANQQAGEVIIASSLTQNVIPNVAESFSGSKNLWLKDMRGVNDQAPELIKNAQRGIFQCSFTRWLEEPTWKDERKTSDIEDLIECIKGHPGEQSIKRPKQKINSCKTDGICEKSQLEIQFEDLGDETSNPECTKPRGCTNLAVLKDKKELNDIHHKFFVTEDPDQNKAVEKFLCRNTPESDLVDAFQQCGDILKVEILSSEKTFFQTAYIYFKNPTRTVKITQLTRDISSHDVMAALASSGSNVTGFFLGALNSVAYVEFEVSISLHLLFDYGHVYPVKVGIDLTESVYLICQVNSDRAWKHLLCVCILASVAVETFQSNVMLDVALE